MYLSIIIVAIQPTPVPQIATYNSNVTFNCGIDSRVISPDSISFFWFALIPPH